MYRRMLLVILLGGLTFAVLPARQAIAEGTLTVHVQGKGTVTGFGINCSDSGATDCSQFYDDPPQDCDPQRKPPCLPQEDAVATVNAADRAGTGYVFDTWSGCDSTSGGGRACFVRLPSNKTVTARFRDSTAPSVSLSAALSGAKRGSIDLSASSSDNDRVSRVEFRVGGQLVGTDTLAPHSSTFNTAARADGAVSVQATAFDAAGNSASHSRTITIDNTAPTVAVGGPDGQAFGPGSTQIWTLDVDGGPSGLASVQCSVVPEAAAAAFGPCSGGSASHSVAGRPEGRHVLAVRAVDGAGNVRTVEREFTIDATPPQTSIASGPAEGSTSTATSATFALVAEPGATFRCRVYPAALTPPEFGACSGPASHTAGGFAPGTYAFEAVATDTVGNVDPTPAKRTFTVLGTTAGGGGSSGGGSTAGGGGSTGGGDTAKTLDVGLTHLWAVRGGRARVLKLTLKGLPKGAKVRVRCKGRGCAFERKTLTAKRSKLALKKLFKKRKLRRGVRIEVRVTAGGHTGKVYRYTVRKGRRLPKSKTLCLAPGARKPAGC